MTRRQGERNVTWAFKAGVCLVAVLGVATVVVAVLVGATWLLLHGWNGPAVATVALAGLAVGLGVGQLAHTVFRDAYRALQRRVDAYAESETTRELAEHDRYQTAVDLLIDKGVLQQVGIAGCTDKSVCRQDPPGHEWWFRFDDGVNDLRDDHPKWPVYRVELAT